MIVLDCIYLELFIIMLSNAEKRREAVKAKIKDIYDESKQNYGAPKITQPFDSWEDLYNLIKELREYTEDDVVIYTGYNKDELLDKIKKLSQFKNIIIKYGRYIPNQTSHYDENLGVNLASYNQYSERIN